MFEKSLYYRAAFSRDLGSAQSSCSKISLPVKDPDWSTNSDLWLEFSHSTCSIVSKGQLEGFPCTISNAPCFGVSLYDGYAIIRNFKSHTVTYIGLSYPE